MCANTTIGVLAESGSEIFLQPIELFGAEDAESAFANVQHIDQPDEVHAVLVEAEPARADAFSLRNALDTARRCR